MHAVSAELSLFERVWIFPTLSWLSSSDALLHLQFAAGTAAAACLICGRFLTPAAITAWILYLSLSIAGQQFLTFQWDSLLLESGLLTIFLIRASSAGSSGLQIFLLRLLLFKLMFGSGLVKILSADPTWHGLTALQFHYETQPLPNLPAYYAHHLPGEVQRFSATMMFAIELIAPWLIWITSRTRLFAGLLIAFLQCLIVLTGNYTFFNLLALALCLLLIDDNAWPQRVRRLLDRPLPDVAPLARKRWSSLAESPLSIAYLCICLIQFSALIGFRNPESRGMPERVVQWVQPLRSINQYGLFAVMTTERNEIVLEGSNDGEHWSTYKFKWKPQDLQQRPRQVAPHQPRLDWQMWFAALGPVRQSPWFFSLIRRLLEGAPAVLDLLGENPFPEAPPKFIRALYYRYHFTALFEKNTEGKWWKRELLGLYVPPIKLQDFNEALQDGPQQSQPQESSEDDAQP